MDGRQLTRPQNIKAAHAGRAYSGQWILEGDRVSVSSAYGSRSAAVPAGVDPEAVANGLMLDLVLTWLQTRPGS